MTAYPDGFTLQEYDVARADAARAQHAVHDAVARVREKRIARIAAGAVGVVGALASFSALLAGSAPAGRAPSDAVQVVQDALTQTTLRAAPVRLGLAAVAALATYGLARLGSRLLRPWRARATTTPALGRLEAWSFGLPLAALALLAPLLIHGAVWAAGCALGREPALARDVNDFAEWMRLSGIFVGHAHVALVVCVIVFVRALRRMSTPELLVARAATRGWKHLAITVAVAAVPGVVVILPPVLVLLTGAAIVPLAYHVAWRALREERLTIERRDACELVPVGIADLEAARAKLALS